VLTQFNIQSWAVFLAFIAILVSIAQIWDRHYLKSETSNRVRNAVIGFYLRLAEPFHWAELKEMGLDFTGYVLGGVGFYGGILFIARMINETLFEFFLVMGLGLAIPIAVYLLGCIVILGMFCVFTLHTVVHFVLVHVLDKMSDPKTSPFTYLLGLLGLTSAIAKAALDFYKMLGP